MNDLIKLFMLLGLKVFWLDRDQRNKIVAYCKEHGWVNAAADNELLFKLCLVDAYPVTALTIPYVLTLNSAKQAAVVAVWSMHSYHNEVNSIWPHLSNQVKSVAIARYSEIVSSLDAEHLADFKKVPILVDVMNCFCDTGDKDIPLKT